MKNLIYFILLISFLLNCKKGPDEYDVKVKINRIEIVREGEDKKPILIDVELNYPDCPGDQIEIIRAGKDFAECFLTKHKVNDIAKAKILWKWRDLGFYKWDVIGLSGCERVVDPEEEGSYDMIEECEDFLEYGAVVGFRCKRVATADLIAACPWFRRK
ncbi:MAG: hypothetical protein KDK36_02110 [Leptospiraceae bacterium]|nr:hypothetical protein [Leptospiraceae bacterium]